MIRRTALFVLLITANILFSHAQESAIGEWRAHLPYRNCIAVAEAGSKVYCASQYALFYFDRTDNSVNRLNKVNGLSDIEISTIGYSETYKTLMVTYVNANIDLITEDGIINISDIKRKNIFGKKTINSIMFLGQYAYLSCGFGIVVVNLARNEISDTYYIGPGGSSLEVNDLTWDGTSFWAATASGIYTADGSNLNLSNFEAWNKDTTLPDPNSNYAHVCLFNNHLIAALDPGVLFSDDTLFIRNDTTWDYMVPGTTDDYKAVKAEGQHLLICGNYNIWVYNTDLQVLWILYTYNPGPVRPMDVVEDDEGFLWIADDGSGLVKNKEWSNTFIVPNGPGSPSVYSMASSGSEIYVAPGSTNSSLGNNYDHSGPFTFLQDNWYTLKDQNPQLDSLWDILYIAVDPTNTQRVFYASWGHGLAEFLNGMYVRDYTYTNSSLEKPFASYNWVGIAGIAFDESGNLWVINSECNNLIKVLKKDGTWISYSSSSVFSQPKATRLMIDSYGQKWVLLFGASGIIVFNDNNTLEVKSDDRIKRLTSNPGNGNLPSNSVLAIAQDLDGEVWVGTDKGLAVFYNPENIFSGYNFDAQVITIEQDSTAQHLLEYETVTAIAVDGANKKWVGTQNAGVFLFSDDGQKEIHHFTGENSPLLSNTITDITIDGNSGEVFFGTDKGICSYKGYATTGSPAYEGVYAYPNPVPPDFDGMIGIRGLSRNSWIKITDISGTLIYETRSEGGQAVWNGYNFNGEKAKSGIYPVFCISEDGSEKIVTKILIVN